MTEKRTVRVRVAVCVTSDGDWDSAGWAGQAEHAAASVARKGVDPEKEEAMYWLEADLVIPTVETIEAEVRDAE